MGGCKERCINAFTSAVCGCEPLTSRNISAHCEAHVWLRCSINYRLWKAGKPAQGQSGFGFSSTAVLDAQGSRLKRCMKLCRKVCEQSWVVASVTSTQFGAEEKQLIKMSDLMRSIYNKPITPDYISRNFILLDIYFQRFSVRQNVMYTVATLNQLTSLIGGQLGLWVGASVITLVEVVCRVLPALLGQNIKKK